MSRRSEGGDPEDSINAQDAAAAAGTPERPPDFLGRAAGALYAAAWWPGLALVAPWMSLSAQRRPAVARIRPRIPELSDRPVWLHACSVGEVNAALPLARVLRERRLDLALLLTVSTPTGMALAQERANVPVAWYPLDHPATVRGFFDRVRPLALVLTETELWPCALARAQALGVPVALVNGRLSDASAAWYRRLAPLWRPGVRGIAAAGMQTETYAARLIELGARPERVRVTGNVKFDAAPATLDEAGRRAIREALGIAEAAPVLVVGSTRPGDESLLAEGLGSIVEAFPDLRVIVAPRHLERVRDAERAFGAWPTVRRTAIASGGSRDAPVILLDTHGELANVYGIATVAVVGGGFSGDVGGHSPIEPSAQGVPVVFGPDMRNFPDAASLLVAAGGAVQVEGAALAGTLAELLRDRARRELMGRRGGEAVGANRGALGRTLDMLLPLLPSASN